MRRCDNGHYYDETKHSSCPACGVNIDLGRTVPKAPSTPPPVMPSSTPPATPTPQQTPVVGGTRRIGNPSVAPTPSIQTPGKTIAVYQEELGGIDPVVGWLVCIEGPDRGRDYRIRSERNFIGRSRTNHICIEGDQSISREKHAVISFNPKKNSFRIMPGDSSGMIYLNEEEVDMPLELSPYDLIEIGKTKLRFIPFCGPHFSWTTEFDEEEA